MSDVSNCEYNVCAIIVSYNGNYTISDTVNALIDQVAAILIVDNASNNETKNILRQLESDSIKILYNTINAGVAHALNQGIFYAQEHGFDWILTMDQDSIAASDMVRNLLDCAKTFDDQSKAVSFSPVVVCGNSDHKVNKDMDFIDRYTVITSGNLLKASIFEKIGLFQEKLFIDSVDFEYCLRIKKHGYRIIRCNKAVLRHSLGTVNNVEIFGFKIPFTTHSPFRKYYIMRNHIYIIKKYMLTFPIYCLWKQTAIVRLILQVLFIEKSKVASLRYLFKGLCDGIVNNYKEL